MIILNLSFHRQLLSYLLGLFLMVSRVNLSKSFNYAPYLFSKKVEKWPYSEITSLLSAGSETE
jgi:hypothetical protein